jgi:hypothetical protein
MKLRQSSVNDDPLFYICVLCTSLQAASFYPLGDIVRQIDGIDLAYLCILSTIPTLPDVEFTLINRRHHYELTMYSIFRCRTPQNLQNNHSNKNNAVLLIRDVYPGCRIRIFSIPDPG